MSKPKFLCLLYTKQRNFFFTKNELFKEKGSGGSNKKPQKRFFNCSCYVDWVGPRNTNKKKRQWIESPRENCEFRNLTRFNPQTITPPLITLYEAFKKMQHPIKILVRLRRLLRSNGIKCLKNLFWRQANRFESLLIQQLKKWWPYWVNLLFCVFSVCFFVVVVHFLKLILFYNRVVYHYPRIFLILLLHSI